MSALKIVCLGGGPASLYFAILMKKQNPAHQITIHERGPRDATWGFGVVFSDDTLQGFLQADAPSYKRIVEEFAYWDCIDTYVHGKKITSGGHGFCGMSRLKLLNILHDRCDELGVQLLFNSDITDIGELQIQEHDLVVAGDGIASILREKYQAEFGTSLDWRSNRFCWLGTTLPMDSFVFLFKQNEHGWWWVHAYRYELGMSTWIVECSETTWRNANMEDATEEYIHQYMEELFKEELQGHPLITNRSVWRQFPVVRNERLFHENIVLLGDSGRSAHFSIGSGTKLAMEDAITLAAFMDEHSDSVANALAAYQQIRKPEADRLQRTAVTSLRWFENIDRYVIQEAEQFTFNMLVRSKRVTYENLGVRDPEFIHAMDRWFVEHTQKTVAVDEVELDKPVAPMFQPFKIGEVELVNRIQLSAMCQYCADEGVPGDWHFVHYGARAIGGAGLINTEMLCISPTARITQGCAGLWNKEQTQQWHKIVTFIHANSDAKVCAQIGHAGRKGATCVPWNGGMDQPLSENAWQLLAPSALPYLPHSQLPKEVTHDDLQIILQDFKQAVANAESAGFDMLEIHMAHGYLLSSFISPVTNHRNDEFGGDIHNRMRFPLQILKAVRECWPKHKPISVRISATDWVDDGLTEQDMLSIAELLRDNGADIINVSTGQVVSNEEPVYGRMFQAPFADQIRNEIGIPVIVAGNITTADQANTLILAGRADIIALARPIMNDPHFVLNAAAHYGYEKQWWPPQYQSGKFAAHALAAKDKEEYEQLKRDAKPPDPREALALAKARHEITSTS